MCKNEEKLSKMIVLKNAILVTTPDAIILIPDRSKQDKDYSRIRLIIHGPYGHVTKHPYILLCNEEDLDHATKIARSLIPENDPEFPNKEDAFAIPSFGNGHYYDERIKWEVI